MIVFVYLEEIEINSTAIWYVLTCLIIISFVKNTKLRQQRQRQQPRSTNVERARREKSLAFSEVSPKLAFAWG